MKYLAHLSNPMLQDVLDALEAQIKTRATDHDQFFMDIYNEAIEHGVSDENLLTFVKSTGELHFARLAAEGYGKSVAILADEKDALDIPLRHFMGNTALSLLGGVESTVNGAVSTRQRRKQVKRAKRYLKKVPSA